MSVVEVNLGEHGYKVSIEAGLLDRAGDVLRPYARGDRLILVSDENVWAAQGPRLAAAGFDIDPILVPPGEASKSWTQLTSLVDRLLAIGVERGDHIIAFGGGMIGDLAGFASAILKRGCSWVQVPTTLLAQVDSSVGGKTGINAGGGKNMVGAFHQPTAVLIDPTALDTLPSRELRAGYAEMVKIGLIGDPAFFAWCEANAAALLAGDAAARLHAIETCVRAKAAIVAEDERDINGRRALLNFGHSFAHALEAEAGYDGSLLHGEAVAIGMALAFRLSVERGLCPPEDSARVDAHLAAVGLPSRHGNASASALVANMANDKKKRNGEVRMILVDRIGSALVADGIALDELEALLGH